MVGANTVSTTITEGLIFIASPRDANSVGYVMQTRLFGQVVKLAIRCNCDVFGTQTVRQSS